MRHCQGPNCSAVIPEHLDAFGPRGWCELVVVLRPLGEAHFQRAKRPREEHVLICPACLAHPQSVGALASRSGFQVQGAYASAS